MIETMTQVGVLRSVQVGTPQWYGTKGATDEKEQRWKTSFVRTPSSQSRWLYTTHLEGNEQADKKHHGQPGQTVLLYASAHYPLWRKELARPELGPGAFGENFTIDGLSEEMACVGDIYALGEAQIQVTGPRYPCWKIERRWSMPGLTARVAETGRTGWYCRAIREGSIEPAMPVVLIERPYPEWTISLVNDFGHSRNKDLRTAQDLAACPLLDEWWGRLVIKRAKGKK